MIMSSGGRLVLRIFHLKTTYIFGERCFRDSRTAVQDVPHVSGEGADLNRADPPHETSRPPDPASFYWF